MRNRDWMMVLLFAAASEASAMHLSQRGMGQVLIASYYTVNAGNQTLVSIANRSDQGKALKVRFLEGMNGREAFGFNLYLAPHDLWTGAVFSVSNDAPATLITMDDSCTVPALKNSTTLPQLPNGRRIAPFNNVDFTGDRNDAGPDDLRRTREGYFEVIEMGEVMNAAQRSLNDITSDSSGIPANCARIESAWAPGGYWRTNSEADLARPGGHLSAAVTLVDALDGTMYSYQAEAIDGFSAIVQHTPPNDARPNLSSGNTQIGQGVVEAVVEIDGEFLGSQYPLSRSIDAVSALLMAQSIKNEFITTVYSGAASSWVVTMPTQKFYSDDALLSPRTPIQPFSKLFSNRFIEPPLSPTRGEVALIELVNRTGINNPIPCPPDLPCTPPLPYALPVSIDWATNVFHFGATGSSSATMFSSALSQPVDMTYANGTEGWMKMSLFDAQGEETFRGHLLRPDNSGRQHAGLPVVGFWAVSFTNEVLLPGVLSNYAVLRPHVRGQSIVGPAP